MRLLLHIVCLVLLCGVASGAEPNVKYLINAGHADIVTEAAVSLDGSRVVTAGYDSMAILWDAKSGAKLREFAGHDERIFSVAMSDNGKRFVTGSADQTAILWDAASGKPLFKLRHADWVWNVAISGSGKLAATGAEDGRAILWDAATGKRLRTLTRVQGGAPEVAISADGRRVATTSGNSIDIWDASTGKKRTTLATDDEVWDFVLSRDGALVLAALLDGVAVVWNVETGDVVRRFESDDGNITSIRLGRDDKHLMIGTAGGKASLWEVATGRQIKTFDSDTQLAGNTRSVGLSGDGALAVTVVDGQKSAAAWNAKTGRRLHALGKTLATVWDVTLSGDGATLASAGGNLVSIWDTATARRSQLLLGHEQEVYKVALSADGKLAVTGSADQTAILWNVATGKAVQRFVAHDDSVNSVGLARDGALVLTCSSGDGTAILWDAKTGKRLRTFQGKIKPDDRSNRFSAAGLSPDGRYLVTGAFDSTVTLWDAATGARRLEFDDHHSQEINDIVFSRDGKRVVTVSWANVNVWDTATGKRLFNVRRFSGFTTAALRGDLLLAGDQEKTVHVWNLATGKAMSTFRGHSDSLWAMALSSDGAFVWSASGDGTLRYWRRRDGRELIRFHHFEQAGDWLAVTPDGFYDGSPTASTLITHRDSGRPIDTRAAKQRFFRPSKLMNLLADEK